MIRYIVEEEITSVHSERSLRQTETDISQSERFTVYTLGKRRSTDLMMVVMLSCSQNLSTDGWQTYEHLTSTQNCIQQTWGFWGQGPSTLLNVVLMPSQNSTES